MPIIEDPSDPASCSASQQEKFSHFKREVYQKVLKKVFQSLKTRSQNGEAHCCGDGISRVLYSGILIKSQDAEEAAYFCTCHAASANHLCPKCFVSQKELHDILGTIELRTPQSMQAVLSHVSKMKTKIAREQILKDNGLHNHFLWGFWFSDPYKAYSYDTLHSDDLGKWGKHFWVLTLSILKNGTKRQAFYDILKLQQTISVYQKCYAKVEQEYGKIFDFLKQHAVHHVIQNIHEKGTVDNFSTRIGEGFQQEAAQAYDQTNMKNAEHQLKLTWQLGSPEGKKTNLHNMATDLAKVNRQYSSLDERYQSLEDWIEGRDIMRCNPKFHGRQRFDCIIIHNDTTLELSIAQLDNLFCFWLPSGETVYLALVFHFSHSKWKPKTT
ncbi:hypothetical protein HYPSUDRAFT_72879 [Hypholoma sublateritium FD-334 SS-4]|uniref:Uncharacterized protein n=1 Tax=Hypholoma sublateritium (strain FD-334 SS-4) TaxID=945553 RepID=A0A0D2LSH6_HYPSF|nr:hypothetical protein HYPSUDRAFT_72879 [Hypholoma sublateritium FD-334 SS-4]